ncbi:MAG: capsular biosynthesis protein [Clostridiales bacterium]|nr:capsular biosynthesis protein [Clostridiales bacterium]
MAEGYWDIHNHILPGVDDGASCMEDTRDLLSSEYEQGIRNIIFTPHCRSSMFRVSTDDREMIYHRVLERMGDRFPDMSFYLGCEYHFQGNLMRDLQDPRCRMAGTRVVLLEFSTDTSLPRMMDTVESVREAGYQIIIAHPERYSCLHAGESGVKALAEAGVRIQINAGSVLGRQGRLLKRVCFDWLKAGRVDFIASDAHSMEYRPVELERCRKLVQKKFGEEQSDRLFRENQSRLFDGAKT